MKPIVKHKEINGNYYFTISTPTLLLEHHVINGVKFSTASKIKKDGSSEIIDHNKNQVQRLWIALINYKNQKNLW